MIHINVEKTMLTSTGKRTLQVDTQIPAHELVAVFGKSGAGKTTLLRMIAGLTAPDSGMIQIGEQLVFDSSRKINRKPQQRNIGFMFQDYALFPNMTVEENIRFARKDDRAFVNHLIEILGLETFRRQKPAKLSGGQQQRVALARSLARKPDILLLDEPLSSLDEEMRLSLQDEILKLHRLFGFTTLMVSHDKEEVERMSSRVLNIDGEKI
jgi:molybdate transport system ATP-binding protein